MNTIRNAVLATYLGLSALGIGCATPAPIEQQGKREVIFPFSHFKGTIDGENVLFYGDTDAAGKIVGYSLIVTNGTGDGAKRREYFDDNADGTLERVTVVEGDTVRFLDVTNPVLGNTQMRAQLQFETYLAKIRAFVPDQRRLRAQRKAEYQSDSLEALEPSETAKK